MIRLHAFLDLEVNVVFIIYPHVCVSVHVHVCKGEKEIKCATEAESFNFLNFVPLEVKAICTRQNCGTPLFYSLFSCYS